MSPIAAQSRRAPSVPIGAILGASKITALAIRPCDQRARIQSAPLELPMEFASTSSKNPAPRCANGAGLGTGRVEGASMQRGQSTLEWVIGAAVILGTLVVGIIAWNQGLVTKIGTMVQQMVGTQ